jgi:hypothetical protein
MTAQFITIINPTTVEVDGNLLVRGTVLKDRLANKTLQSKFENGFTLCEKDATGVFGTAITGAGDEAISDIEAKISAYARPSVHLTFKDSVLTSVSVRETF